MIEPKDEDFIQIRLADTTKKTRAGTELFRMLYTAPAGTTIRRITCDYRIRCGEGAYIIIYNVGTSASDLTINSTSTTGSIDETLATASNAIEIQVGPSVLDLYDSNDYIWLDNIVIYCTMDDFAAPTYTQGEIVQDILSIASTHISADYSDIGEPALVLSPFITENDDYQSADSVIQAAAAYGDASLNTWGLSVWDEFGATDGLPKAEFKARSVADYDWLVTLADLDAFDYQDDDSQIYNYVIVQYRDDKNITRYHTPTDNTSQTDAASIAAYGRRDYVYDIGDGDATRAEYVGDRFLQYHKDPLPRCSMTLTGRIRDSHGRWQPANRVRAGDRVRVADWQGGVTYFLRTANYDAETMQLSMGTDLSPETLPMLLARQEIGA
jgi:hypothetical protein